MLKYLLIFLVFSYSTTIKAQKNAINFDINDYKNTINFIDHKLFFQTKPSKEPKFIHSSKKYYWYSNNQIHITQGGFSGRLLNGSYSDFYLSSSLKEKGTFKTGLKEGEWSVWTEDGILIERMNYKQGVLNGQFMKYDKTGSLWQEGNYMAGKIEGVFKTYHGIDSIMISKYKKGVVKTTSKNWLKQIFSKKHK